MKAGIRFVATVILCIFVSATPAFAESWDQVHERTLKKNHLQENPGLQHRCQRPATVAYQEERFEVVSKARDRFLASLVPAAPTPSIPVQPVQSVSYSGDIYDALAMCESGQRNLPCASFCGYFQFLPSTYASVTGRSCVTCDSYAVQKAAAIALIARSGWGQFPSCARQLGML